MARKRTADEGIFESAGKAVDESLAMAAALREGRLTRAKFDSWYSRRVSEGANLIGGLRRRTTSLLEPVTTTLERKGKQVLGAVAPLPRRRSRRRRRTVRARVRARVRRLARRA